MTHPPRTLAEARSQAVHATGMAYRPPTDASSTEPERCSATTAAGTPCKRTPDSTGLCPSHR